MPRHGKNLYEAYRVSALRPKRPGPSVAEARHQRRIAVSQWWQSVVARRHLWSGYAPPAHEVAGEGPWPAWAVLQALHAEYASGSGPRMTRRQFAYWLRECTPCRPIGVHHHEYTNERGRVIWYSSNTKYQLPARN